MKKKHYLFTLIVIAFLFGCTKDEKDQDETQADSIRLVVQLPNFSAYYNFSSDPDDLNSTGESFYDILVENSEMVELADNLKDNSIYEWNWEDMTSQSPYPSDDCVLLIYGNIPDEPYNDIMCSIGSGESAAELIQELGKNLTGNSKEAFNNIYLLLSGN